MSANPDIEAQLLDRYWEETKNLCDQLMEANVNQEKAIRKEIGRKLQIYDKQIKLFQSQFPDNEGGKIYEASYYQLQALELMGSSSVFRKTPGARKSLVLAVAAGGLAKAQEKNNAQKALGLLDKSIATFDTPNARHMKAGIYSLLGQKNNAINELNYVLANFQDDPIYIEARTLKDEIENPPKKGMCFVATAAYGSPLADEVVLLSRFRDEVLLKSTLGTIFVTLYYRTSPPIASVISKVDFLRAATRKILLSPILSILKFTKFSNK